jgi:replicative DNA helicase
VSSNGHVPPQNLEAEESVLGAMMLTPNAIEAAAEATRASDFYRPAHGVIFDVALDLHAKGEPVDALTLADELEKRGVIEQAGGSARIHELARSVPAAGNAGHYARIVAELAGLRRLIAAGGAISKLGWDRPGELDDLIEQAEKHLTEATTLGRATDFVSTASSVSTLADEIEAAYKEGVTRFGLRTRYLDLDKVLTGLHPGTLTLLAARPSMGKSALAVNICENVADGGDAAGIVSLEMSRAELDLRQLSRACRIDSQVLRTARMSEEEYERFRKGLLVVKGRQNLYVDDSPTITSGTLRASARRLHRQHNAKLLVVDYLQLLVSSSTEDSRQQEIASISRSLKLLAKELHIPIIALSQLNRNVEAREDKRPRLSDLRDSGALEQDADTVLFIYRDEYYHPDSQDQGIAEVLVAKNRMGPSGTVRLGFNTRFSTFLNLAKETT